MSHPFSLAPSVSRRAVLAMGAASLAGASFQPVRANPQGATVLTPSTSTYSEGTLPKGVRSRMIQGVNGLDVHLLEAGHESPGRPLALLLHGFPDLAYGWRHLMPILADAGYHVVAPDQRGFGRTTGWDGSYDAQLGSFSLLNMTRELRLFSGRTIDVPSLFIGGKSDWAHYVSPGGLELMKTRATTRMSGIELIDGAGHWIQQEQPARLGTLLLAFMKEVGGADHKRG